MQTYQDIKNQVDMDRLLESINRFHDSMTKEVHIVNRGAVHMDHAMSMCHQFDAQVLIQSQWAPYAIELLFVKVLDMDLGSPGPYRGSAGVVTIKSRPVDTQTVQIDFDESFHIKAEKLLYRVRSDWLGKKCRLCGEVPAPEMVLAVKIKERWRQCSVCCDAWEEDPQQSIAYCPGCGVLTASEDEK